MAEGNVYNIVLPDMYGGEYDAVNGIGSTPYKAIKFSNLTWSKYESVTAFPCYQAEIVDGEKPSVVNTGTGDGLSDRFSVVKKDYNSLENGELLVGVTTSDTNKYYVMCRCDQYTTVDDFISAMGDTTLIYRMNVEGTHAGTPTDIEMDDGTNTVSSGLPMCMTYMFQRGDLSEAIANAQKCCKSDSCDTVTIIDETITNDGEEGEFLLPLTPLVESDEAIYRFTVNNESYVLAQDYISGVDSAWWFLTSNMSASFYRDDGEWGVRCDKGTYHIKVETVCPENGVLMVDLTAAPNKNNSPVETEKTSGEINEAILLGKQVIFNYRGVRYFVCSSSQSSAVIWASDANGDYTFYLDGFELDEPLIYPSVM